MIRAVGRPGVATKAALTDYRALTSMVRVEPRLAALLTGDAPPSGD